MGTEAASGLRPLVCVAIPAYRSPRLRECLASLRTIVGDGIPFEVHVVLNDVTPEVREIAENFEAEWVRFIDAPANLGIAGGLNAAFAASEAPFLLGLQDDAIVEPGWLRYLIERIETAPDIGAVGGLALDSNGEVWDAGWVVWGDGITSPVWMNASRDPADYDASRAIAQHGSAGLLMRREAWKSIGGFDDSFYPAYYSDVDICVSLRKRGWRLIFEPRSRMHHAINSSSTRPYIEFLLERNRQRLLLKHGPFLAGMGNHSNDPKVIAKAASAIADTPAGVVPAPPTQQELDVLRTRIERSTEEVLRKERNVLWDYARHLEHRWEETCVEQAAALEALEGSARRLSDTERALTAALAERDRIWHQLEAISTSASWRSTAIIRAIKRGMTRTRHTPSH
jgi:GT2 family glycosyltransferase